MTRQPTPGLHENFAGEAAMSADKAMVRDILRSLREDMGASPVDDVTVINRTQLDALSAALAQSETQPVAPIGYMREPGFRSLAEGDCTSIYPKPRPHDWYTIPVFASPVPAKREAGVVKAREVLFFASYCGDDNPSCSEKRPCPVCLGMSNVYEIPADTPIRYKRELSPGWLSDRALAIISEALPGALSTSSTPADGEDRAAPVANLQGLTTFAKAMIQVAFQGGDISGADIQELGVQHGLLSCVPFDPEKHKDPEGYAEEGEYWYVYAGPLATTEAAE